jgi:WXG100 family type VII secretion target
VPNFMTDPEAMMDHSRRFAGHADAIHQHSQSAYNSATEIAGAGWSGQANQTSTGSVEQMTQAFANIRDMMQWASDNIRSAHDTYVQRELDSAHFLST